MTCKNCIHYDVCGKPAILKETTCKEFKDKSKYIEVPCKVGDTVYVLWYSEDRKEYEILQNTVWNFTIDEYGLSVNTNNIEMGIFGKLIFFTREEAEKALKEREDNGNRK